ncbi:immunoglobulin-like domain-containing protein [Paenibacillus sp. HB172176]|uniref:immunoglobulin-like domain-containing protein n=1 Tax=Paenibacillus sp. HB172176 TaxID=2493690 RepID=UPI00143C7EDF|nr:immunoglobulin-like domain-containing protein [Paenibacillus sp. HB172176]
MKLFGARLSLAVIGMLLFAFLIPGQSYVSAAVTEWQPVGDEGFSEGAAYYNSIAIDSNGTPFVVYNDQGNSGKATAMKYNGSSWEAVGNAGFSAGKVSFPSLALDGSGTPYVVYRDIANSKKATVMKYNGSSWETVGNAGFSAGDNYYTSIVLDSGDTPYVVYKDEGNISKATVMRYDGSNWEEVGDAGFSAGAADYISIVLDSNDTPYVVYKDAGNSNKATVMKYNGSVWEEVGNAGFSAGTAEYTSIVLDSGDTPYVAYRDAGNANKATVMKYNGSVWEEVGNAGFSAGSAEYTSIVLDSGDTPYVAYRDFGNSSKATVMKFNGSSWEEAGSAGFSVADVSYVAIALDGSDTPYVVYQDGGNANKATLMKLAAAYNVTYDGNGSVGGSVPSDSNTYSEGMSVTAMTNSGNLAKEGFIFAGWNTAADGSGVAYGAGDLLTMGEEDVTLYAQWAIPVTMEVGQALGAPGDNVDVPVFLNPGDQSFWQYAMDIAYDASVLELAGETPVTDEAGAVIFDLDTSTEGIIRVADASFLSFMEEKTKALTLHFKIKDSAAPGDSSVTVNNASYTVDTEGAPIEASFITSGRVSVAGTVDVMIGSVSGNAGESVQVPVSVSNPSAAIGAFGMQMVFDPRVLAVTDISGNTGDLFLSNYDNSEGWLKTAWADAEGGDHSIAADQAIYTITFLIQSDVDSGDVSLSVTDANDPQFFTFTDLSGLEMGKALTSGKVTVVPTYSVMYDGNGHDGGSVPTDSHAYAEEAIVSVMDNTENLVKFGYMFGGWNTADDGTGDSYLADETFMMGTDDVTLYAKWLVNEYKISFESNEGSAVSDVRGDYGTTINEPAEPTREGYAFGGWYKDSEMTSVWDFESDTVPVDGTTLYAKWAMTDAEAVAQDKAALVIAFAAENSATSVTQSVYLTEGGTNGTAISWLSDKPEVIDSEGNVTRPGFEEGDAAVTLTATIRKGEVEETQTFEVIVKRLAQTDAEAVAQDKAALVIAFAGENSATSVTQSVYLTEGGTNGTTISWSSDKPEVVDSEGNVTRPASRVGDVIVTLTATIRKGEAEETRTFEVIVLAKASGSDSNNGGGSHAGSDSSDDSSSGGAETIQVDVEASGAGTVTQTEIKRTTLPDGTKRDLVALSADKAKEAAERTREAGSDKVRVVIPDAEDEVSEVRIELPAEALQAVVEEELSLEIYTDNATITIPQETLADANEDYYFRIVPLKTENEREEAEQRARTETVVRLAVGNEQAEQMEVVGQPMTIETNMQSRRVEIVLPLADETLSEEQLGELGVFIEHSDGEKELVRGEIFAYGDSGKRGIKFTVTHFSTFTIVHADGWQQGSSNGDEPAALHTAYISGYEDGTFGPDKAVSRAEMAAMLARIYGADAEQGSIAYTDVAAGHWAKDAIGAVAALGLMQGYPDGSFRPERTITRAEMASIAANLLNGTLTARGGNKSPGASGKGSFLDTSGHWAEEAITQAKAAGIINGYEDGTFRPDETLTRAQAVTILNKLQGRDPLTGAEQRWSDVPASHWAYGHIQEASAGYHD